MSGRPSFSDQLLDAKRGAPLGLAGGEVLSRLLLFAAFVYLARSLGPAGYGAVELAVASAYFFALIVDLGLGSVGARAVERNRGLVHRLSGDIPAVRLLLAALAIPAMGGVVVLAGQPPETVRLVWIFSISLLAIPLTQRWLFQGLERPAWVAGGQILRSSVFAVGVVVFVRGAGDLAVTGVVEVAAAMLTAGYYLFAQTANGTPFRIHVAPREWVALVRTSSSVGFGQVFWGVSQFAPVVLVAAMATEVEALAWFGAAHRIVLTVLAFGFLYYFALLPAMALCLNESAQVFGGLVRSSFRVASWVGVGLALVGTLFAEPLCVWIFGEAFGGAAPALAILVWVIPVTLVSGHARWALIAGDAQRFVWISQLCGALVAVLLATAAIPNHGAVGAAVAMLASSLTVWGIAHLAATQYVAEIPFFLVGRPLVIAAGLSILREAYAPEGIEGAVAAILAFALSILFVDRGLLTDVQRIRRVVRATKGPVPIGRSIPALPVY